MSYTSLLTRATTPEAVRIGTPEGVGVEAAQGGGVETPKEVCVHFILCLVFICSYY